MDVDLIIDDVLCSAREGEILAAVLLRQPRPVFRLHPIDGSPRAAFCMMGTCFECMVEVDGRPNQQACLIEVAPGMRIRRGIE